MRFEKKLQKMVDESLQKEFGNDEFLAELKKMQAEKNKDAQESRKSRMRLKKRSISIWASCCLIAILAVVLPCVFLIDREEPFGGYLQANEVQLSSDAGIFNETSERLILNKDFAWHIKKCIDSVSGDQLYFKAISNFEHTVDRLEIRLITNPRYHYVFTGSTDKEGSVKGIKIRYSENVEFDEELGLNVFTCYGVIKTGNQTLYIEYDGYADTEVSPFLSFLESVLELK